MISPVESMLNQDVLFSTPKKIKQASKRQQPIWRIVRSLGSLLALTLIPATQLVWFSQSTQAQVSFGALCATPGKDGIDSGAINVVNSYYPAISSVSAGATSISLGSINTRGNQTPISPGDLLLVIQMQDADINFSDTSNYGANNNTGSGSTNINNAGLYEYVVALNTVGTGGGTLQIRGTGSGGGLRNGYRQQAASITTNGQRTYQIVRVPQYTNATLTGTIRSPGSWNGSSGGIVAIDVAETFTLSNGRVEVQDKGFRGGGGTTNTDTYPVGEDESYRTDGETARGGMKGEGIAGTPLRVFDGVSSVSTSLDGYPRQQSQDNSTYRSTTTGTTNGGSRGRGAPGNAGGGGNQHNAGGGGGGNGGVGGQGGNSINSPPADETPSTGVSKPIGGKGGAAFPATSGRLVMGGGGGAGDANNGVAGSGGLGGGIILVRANNITGTGTFSAKAKDGAITPTDDGGAGAGAGGSILIQANSGSLANISLDASGGNGGNVNTNTSVPYDFGPGGGGGGGVIFSSLPTGVTNVSGGQPGRSFNGQLGGSTGVIRGAQPGTNGQVTSSITSTQIPGILSGADCASTVSGVIWNDANGSVTQTTGENGTNAGGLFVYAVNGSGTVIDKASVQTDGTYKLLVPNSQSYTLRLSINGTPTPGQSAPTASLPSGWVNTGENLNGTSETTTLGEIAVAVGTSDVINQNFGIERSPDTTPITAPSQKNPGGSIQVQAPTLNGNDPEDGSLGVGKSFKIFGPATNGKLYYNGTLITASQVITNYDPALLKIDPDNSSGSITVTFSYAAIDAAGKEDPTPAVISIPFTVGSAKVLLVKRITAINGNRIKNPNDNRPLNTFVDDTTSPLASDDNHPNWPSNYLLGEINAGQVKPGDTIEYTIYFLNAEGASASQLLVCDRIIGVQTFQANAYGIGKDMQLQKGNTTPTDLTQANDLLDRARFLTTSTSAPASCNLLPVPSGAADNGTVVFGITGSGSTAQPDWIAVPGASAPGTPTDAYGFVRFTTKVN
jgi:hypothetical protein